MTQHTIRLRLHMGCGESLNSRWLPAPRKVTGTAHATRLPRPSKQRRERMRG